MHRHDYAQFLEELRSTRARVGMTQTDLANLLGTGQPYVSKCEAGLRRIDIVELDRWVAALGDSLSAFVSRYEARRDRNRPP